jgi:hypothetical protein
VINVVFYAKLPHNASNQIIHLLPERLDCAQWGFVLRVDNELNQGFMRFLIIEQNNKDG